MSRPVIVVSRDATLTAALKLMVAGRLRHLAVVDDSGRCLGALADRAIAAEWAHDSTGFGGRRVREVLEPAVSLVPVTASIATVAGVMRRTRTDAVVVVEAGGRPVGIVTATDLIALLAADEPA
jgi:CBS domain-containing protein